MRSKDENSKNLKKGLAFLNWICYYIKVAGRQTKTTTEVE